MPTIGLAILHGRKAHASAFASRRQGGCCRYLCRTEIPFIEEIGYVTLEATVGNLSCYSIWLGQQLQKIVD